MGEYYIGYTPKTKEKFYFDSKNFDIVNQYRWKRLSNGNIATMINNHSINMSKILFGDGQYVYKNGNRKDLREENVSSVRGYKNNGKTYLNGYIAIYMPEHHRAFDNGCVYEHVLEAEKMLGRQLNKEECVHHKNFNRQDNSHENLMVFATSNDHIAFHNGAKAILTDNGSYIVERKIIPFYRYNNRTVEEINNDIKDKGSIYIPGKEICPYCKKNIKDRKAVMCIECRNKIKAKNIPPKNELEKLLYLDSFVSIGKKFGVTDSAVRKWCKNMDFHIKARIYMRRFVIFTKIIK